MCCFVDFRSQIAVLWLKAVIKSHAGQLMANSNVRDTLSPVLGLVETRLGLLAPLSRLRGRLDLLVDQIGEGSRGNVAGDLEESLLVFQDQGSRPSVFLLALWVCHTSFCFLSVKCPSFPLTSVVFPLFHVSQLVSNDYVL
jgi:hypothetical protein